jgi:hypothetical protein
MSHSQCITDCDSRELRDRQIATAFDLRMRDNDWLVTSQSGAVRIASR